MPKIRATHFASVATRVCTRKAIAQKTVGRVPWAGINRRKINTNVSNVKKGNIPMELELFHAHFVPLNPRRTSSVPAVQGRARTAIVGDI